MQRLSLIGSPGSLTGPFQQTSQRAHGDLSQCRRSMLAQQSQDGRSRQVRPSRQMRWQFGKDGNQLILQPLPGRDLALHQIATGARQGAQGLHRFRWQNAGACQSQLDPFGNCLRIERIGLGAQSQALRPGCRLVQIEDQHGIARVDEGIKQRFPQNAGRFHPDHRRRWIGPLLQLRHQLLIGISAGGNRPGLAQRRSGGPLHGTDSMRVFGDINSHNTLHVWLIHDSSF